MLSVPLSQKICWVDVSACVDLMVSAPFIVA